MALMLFNSTKSINLPIELIEKILDTITDTKTYKNSRLVSKYWYHYLRVLKKFENNSLINLIEFNNNNIICRDIYNILIFEYIDQTNGNSIYKKYNSKGVLVKMVNMVIPYYIKIWSVENNIVSTKFININTNKINESSYVLIHDCNII